MNLRSDLRSVGVSWYPVIRSSSLLVIYLVIPVLNSLFHPAVSLLFQPPTPITR